MSRIAAFALLTWAAFDLPTWQLDRTGVALLGLAFAALAATGRLRPPKPARFAVAKRPALLDDEGRVDESRLDAIIRSSSPPRERTSA